MQQFNYTSVCSSSALIKVKGELHVPFLWAPRDLTGSWSVDFYTINLVMHKHNIEQVDRPEGSRSVMPLCLEKANKPKHVRMEKTLAWCLPHYQGHICGQTCQSHWEALLEAAHWGRWKEMSCHSHYHCHFKNISYPKLPQIIPKLYVLTAATTEIQPEGREKNTVRNTAQGEGKPWPECLW